MSDFDYLNARVRGMSTAFLRRELYDEMLAAEGDELLVDLLLSSSHAAALREVLTVKRGLAAAESAMRRHLHATLAFVRRIAPELPRRLLDVQLAAWDTANVLALVRGVSAGASREAIMEAVLPVGEMSEARLEELAASPGLQRLAGALATWGYGLAGELRAAILDGGERPELAALELALNRAYFAWAFQELRSLGSPAKDALAMLRMQADLANVRAALDHVRHRERGKAEESFELVEGGGIPLDAVERLASSASLIGAFEQLESTYFSSAIERGILAYGGGGSLGVMERFLETVVIAAGCRLFRTDPLGAGVSLGFVWRVYNEFVNLRILFRGKVYRMPANAIREELLIV